MALPGENRLTVGDQPFILVSATEGGANRERDALPRLQPHADGPGSAMPPAATVAIRDTAE